MITATPSEQRTPRADEPFISSDLPFELARLQASPAYALEGHTGRTLTKYPELRVVLQTMKAGVRLPFHETAEQMTVQVLLGQLRIWLPYGQNCDLYEGSFAAIDAGQVHELESLQDSAFLLTLTWPPVGRRAASGEVETDGAGI